MARKRLNPAQPKFLDATPPADTPIPTGRPRPLGPPIAQVAAESASESALRGLADDISKARADGRMVLEIPISDIAPDHLARDRVLHGGEDMEALVSSIRTHGQRMPIEVTEIDGPHPYGLISGWRRISALEHLAREAGDGRYSTVLALLRRPKDSADAYVAMVEENEIRVGLSYYERARVAGEAVKRGVFETEKQALLTLFATASRPKRSRIRAFLDIYHAFDSVLQHPAALAERQGLALVQALRADPSLVARIYQALDTGRFRSAEEELSLLAGLVAENATAPAPPPDVPHAEPVSEALNNGLKVVLKNGKIIISGTGVSEGLFNQLKPLLEEFDPS